MRTASICVFCGARSGHKPAYAEAAIATGKAIATQGWRLVYGAELRHLQCTDFSGLLGQKPFNGITDLRLRVGTTLGKRAMVYGALGYSWVNFEAPFGKQTIAGPNAGVGIEINATDKVFAGVDHTARSLTGEGGETSFDLNVATTTLRLGLRF